MRPELQLRWPFCPPMLGVASILGCGLATLLLCGCSSGGSASSTGSATSGNAVPAAGSAPGEQVYTANNCANCHAINGQGGRQGPELTHAGSTHDAQWLAEHVRNPKTHSPSSRMPAFQGKIADADLTALGEYLASLK